MNETKFITEQGNVKIVVTEEQQDHFRISKYFEGECSGVIYATDYDEAVKIAAYEMDRRR